MRQARNMIDNLPARLDWSSHLRAARLHKPDPALDAVLALYENDRASWDALPDTVRSTATVYADLRRGFEAAVAAGVVDEQGREIVDSTRRPGSLDGVSHSVDSPHRFGTQGSAR